MSTTTYGINGFGFPCKSKNWDEDWRFANFIRNHKKSFCKSEDEKSIFNEFFNPECRKTLGEILEDYNYCCDTSGDEGLGAIISNIMTRETGIRFSYFQSGFEYNAPAVVIFEQSYPWQLNDTEKALTEEKLRSICRKYTEELGITDDNGGPYDPDTMNLVYCG